MLNQVELPAASSPPCEFHTSRVITTFALINIQRYTQTHTTFPYLHMLSTCVFDSAQYFYFEIGREKHVDLSFILVSKETIMFFK